jgi:hypothetical protein
LTFKLLKSKMPRLTEKDKVLMISKLEERWSIGRVAPHDGLNKNTVLQVKKRRSYIF